MNANAVPLQLSDEEFARIAHLLPRARGNAHLHARTVLEAVLYVMRSDCPWNRLPPAYGAWHTVYTRARRWAHSGRLTEVLETLKASQETSSTDTPPQLHKPARSIPTGKPPARHLQILAEDLRPMIFGLARFLKEERSGLNISQLDVAILMSIEADPGIGTSLLARVTGEPRATIALAIRRLAEQGCLDAAVRAPDDRRRATLVLTEIGRQSLREVRASRSGQLVRQLRLLDPDQVHALQHSLLPLQNILEGLRQTFGQPAVPAPHRLRRR